MLNVSFGTLQAWKGKYAPFRKAIQTGTQEFDQERVESALLRCATGFVRKQVTTNTTRRDGQEYRETVEVREEVPGDVRAQMFWLCNHDPQQWKPLSQTGQEPELNDQTRGTFVVPEPEDPATWLRRAPSQAP